MAFNFPNSWGPFPDAQFPYTQTGALNMDWVLAAVKAMQQQLNLFVSLNTIKYANPFQWDITRQYAQNTLVIDPQDGTAYLSVQPVPQGVQITDTEYWAPVFTLQNFTDALKTAITTVPQQENGQQATMEIPANSVFFVGDLLCTNKDAIPMSSIIVIGANCRQVSVIELIVSLMNTPTAWYRESDTSINMGFPPAATATIYAGDVHTYDEAEQTITITGR